MGNPLKFHLLNLKIEIKDNKKSKIKYCLKCEMRVPNVKIKYIRKPVEISYTNGVGCELAVHTHDEIVEMTVKSILEGIQDPRYQTQTMETFESE